MTRSHSLVGARQPIVAMVRFGFTVVVPPHRTKSYHGVRKAALPLTTWAVQQVRSYLGVQRP
jgi:hypothetical protein